MAVNASRCRCRDVTASPVFPRALQGLFVAFPAVNPLPPPQRPCTPCEPAAAPFSSCVTFRRPLQLLARSPGSLVPLQRKRQAEQQHVPALEADKRDSQAEMGTQP